MICTVAELMKCPFYSEASWHSTIGVRIVPPLEDTAAQKEMVLSGKVEQ